MIEIPDMNEQLVDEEGEEIEPCEECGLAPCLCHTGPDLDESRRLWRSR